MVTVLKILMITRVDSAALFGCNLGHIRILYLCGQASVLAPCKLARHAHFERSSQPFPLVPLNLGVRVSLAFSVTLADHSIILLEPYHGFIKQVTSRLPSVFGRLLSPVAFVADMAIVDDLDGPTTHQSTCNSPFAGKLEAGCLVLLAISLPVWGGGVAMKTTTGGLFVPQTLEVLQL